MSNKRSFTFNELTNSRHSRNTLSKAEESLIQECRRVNFGEDTIYNSFDTVTFTPLPSDVPEEIAENNNYCLMIKSSGIF